jgi:uncharacterized protein YegP (UPF0339 family)
MATGIIGSTGGLLGALQQYQFTVHRNTKGEFYFVYHNIHGDVEPICWSEGYSSKQACDNAINKVRNGAAAALYSDKS